MKRLSLLIATGGGAFTQKRMSRVRYMIDYIGSGAISKCFDPIYLMYEDRRDRVLEESFPDNVIPVKYRLPIESAYHAYELQGIFSIPLIVNKLKSLGQVDVTLASMPRGALIGLCAKALGFTRFFMYDDMDLYSLHLHNSIYWPIVDRFERLIIDIADAFFTVSKSLLKFRTKATKKQGYVVHTGVNLQTFQGAKAHREAQSSSPHNQIVFVGSIRPEIWGTDLLLRAMKIVVSQVPEAHLHLIGDGPDLDALKTESRLLGLADHVTFYGSVSHEQVPLYLEKGDIGIALYRPGSASAVVDSVKIKEYFASGLPVISTRVGDLADIVESNKAGLLCNYNEKDVASAILKLMTDSSLYQKMSSRAYEIARTKYNIEAQFSKMFRTIIKEYQKHRK